MSNMWYNEDLSQEDNSETSYYELKLQYEELQEKYEMLLKAYSDLEYKYYYDKDPIEKYKDFKKI